MWHVIVEEKGTRKELARYTYSNKEDARRCQLDVRDIRINQNRERVWVRLKQE